MKIQHEQYNYAKSLIVYIHRSRGVISMHCSSIQNARLSIFRLCPSCFKCYRHKMRSGGKVMWSTKVLMAEDAIGDVNERDVTCWNHIQTSLADRMFLMSYICSFAFNVYWCLLGFNWKWTNDFLLKHVIVKYSGCMHLIKAGKQFTMLTIFLDHYWSGMFCWNGWHSRQKCMFMMFDL